MRSVGSHSTSGREKEGNEERTGLGHDMYMNINEHMVDTNSYEKEKPLNI